MTDRWPYPGDSAVVRAKRVALAYRQRLQEIDPQSCAALDDVMRGLGQGWAVPRPVVADPDAWVPAADAAELAAVGMSTLRDLRRGGRLVGRRISERRWEYRVGDILALATAPRQRKRTP